MRALHLKAGMVCVHSAPDVMPVGHPHPAAAVAQPKCYGNGVNGMRVQLLYAHVTGKPDRSGEIVPKILKTWVPKMEGAVRATSKAQGREIGMRFHAPECNLGVDIISIPAFVAYPGPNDPSQPLRVMDYVHSQGFNKIDRKYLLWLDEASTIPNVCGVAVQAHGPVVGDGPAPANVHNVGANPVVPHVAIAFRANNQRSKADGCWGKGGMGAVTEMHELLHTLGAVQGSAPNSNGFGHCTDDKDIMCYAERGIPVRIACRGGVELLDCGSDDYFHMNPPSGSYLATRWNVAKSLFFDEAVGIDLIPVEVRPRP